MNFLTNTDGDRLSIKTAHGLEIEIAFDEGGYAWRWMDVDGMEYLPDNTALKGLFVNVGTMFDPRLISLDDLAAYAEDVQERGLREDRAAQRAQEAHERCCARGRL